MPQKVILAFISLFFVWMMITGFDTQEIILGIFVSGLISIISSREFIKGSVAPKLHPRRWFFFLVYIAVFVMEEIYSHLDLIQRILFDKVNAEFFILKTKFRNPLALTVLGNSITLTPGTLTLDIKGNQIHTYCLDVQSERITKRFEVILERIFK